TIWEAIVSVLFRRDLLQQTGLFRVEIGPRADEEWVLRASLASDVAWVPGKLAAWRRHPNQATPTEFRTSGKDSWISVYGLLLHCLESVLADRNAGIPESWKTVKGWKRIIAASRREAYRHHLGLYRHAIYNPRRFLSSALIAIREDPQYLTNQILNGFRWQNLE